MKKIISLLFAVTIVLGVKSQSIEPNKNKRYFDINKSIEIFNAVIREIDMVYVDSVKVDSLVDATINSMLIRLDPYTE